jgi:hypothetical protein
MSPRSSRSAGSRPALLLLVGAIVATGDCSATTVFQKIKDKLSQPSDPASAPASAGSATSAGTPPAAPAPANGSDPSTRNASTRAALECGIGGAVLVGAACKIWQKKSNAVCAAEAVLAAATAGFACHVVANQLVKRDEELKGQEQNLSAQIAYTKGVNADVAGSNDLLRRAIDDTKKRIKSLNDLIAANQATQDQIDQERRREDADLASARQRLSQQKAALDKAQRFQASHTPPSADLDAEVKKASALYATTQSQVNELASLRQRV